MLDYLIIILIILISLVIGSFLNVVIHRLPAMILSQDDDSPLWNIAWPGSHCPSCQNALKWWHNIPIFSYLLLRGQCAFCKCHISIQYPLVELITALIAVLVFVVFENAWLILQAWCLMGFLIPLVVIDWHHELLPNELTLTLLWVGLLFSVISPYAITPDSAIIGSIVGYLSFWLLDNGYYLVRGQHGLGGGDMKLMAAWGAWLSIYALPYIALVGSVLALGGFAIRYIRHRNEFNQRMAFGPYLIVAGLLCWFVQLNY